MAPKSSESSSFVSTVYYYGAIDNADDDDAENNSNTNNNNNTNNDVEAGVVATTGAANTTSNSNSSANTSVNTIENDAVEGKDCLCPNYYSRCLDLDLDHLDDDQPPSTLQSTYTSTSISPQTVVLKLNIEECRQQIYLGVILLTMFIIIFGVGGFVGVPVSETRHGSPFLGVADVATAE